MPSENPILQRIDLIGDFGGKELFALDGDSLLAYFLFEQSQDNFLSPLKKEYDNNNLFKEESSPLFLIYLVEKLLNDLCQKDAHFQIVFFEQHGRALCRSDYRLAAYREALYNHLCINTEFQIFRFEHWMENKPWIGYLQYYRPLFVMLYGVLSEKQIGPNADFEIYSNLNFGFETHCKSLFISVAFMSDMSIENGRVIAYVDYFHTNLKEVVITNALTMESQEDLENSEVKKTFTDMVFGIPDCRLVICSGFLSYTAHTLTEPLMKLIAKVFALNCFLLNSIPIEYRSVPLADINPKLKATVHEFLVQYYKVVFHILLSEKALATLKSLPKPVNIYDLVDEKLLINMTQKMVNKEISWADFDNDLQTRLLQLWKDNVEDLSQNPEIFFASDVLACSDLTASVQAPVELKLTETSTTGTLVPLNNMFFEQFYPSNLKELPPSSTNPSTIHIENRHWHCYQQLEIEQHKMDKYELKQHQKYIRFIDRYAKSLTGVKGLYNKSIICIAKTNDGKKPKKTGSSEASKKIQAQNTKTKEDEDFQKCIGLIKSLRLRVKDISATSKKLKEIESSKGKILESSNPELKISVHWLKLQTLIDDWMALCNEEKGQDENAATLVEQLGVIFVECTNMWSQVTELCNELNLVCTMLGFKNFFHVQASNDEKENSAVSQTKNKKKASSKKGSKIVEEIKLITTYNKELTPRLKFNFRENRDLYKLSVNSCEFQLKYLGGFMNRCNASGKIIDPRVAFRPDEWQAELLDIIDREESALICAPTSSGKTYVAYYAMEKIISANDNDIVVYVAPTKALVNQVSAEVYARYKKNYVQGGQNVWGIWTREYRYMPMDCQVLITVPEMLEILLLSPLHLEWTRRIKRVIFDEIHCMGQLDGGRVWEHLLVMCSMPILCLSATLGSPENFLKWLQSVQMKHNIKVHLVQCPFRHSDLAKYSYSDMESENPDKPELVPPKGGSKKKLRSKGVLTLLHPWGSLCINAVIHTGIPASAKLSPNECFMVSNILQALGIENSKHLWVDNYFDDSSFIWREDVFKFESDLRACLTELAKHNSKAFEEVIGHLSGKLKTRTTKKLPKINTKEPEIYEKDLPFVAKMALDLRDHEMLPAICFHFDRSCNEEMAEELTEALTEMEKDIRANPEYQKKMSHAMKEKEAQEKLRKKKSNVEMARDKKRLEAGGDMEDSVTSFDYQKHDPYCTLVGRNSTTTASDVEEMVKSFDFKLPDNKHFLIEAMKRGIGVHHAGMPRKYLASVETLMRSGYLSLVFGTETLALGINMPCKTSVFMLDSIFLTPSEYQQMSGRAGRRGFDQEGYVVFVKIRQEKVDRLLCAELPALSGHFPLTTTLVLRLFLLHSQTEDILMKEVADAKSKKQTMVVQEKWCKNLDMAQDIIKSLLQNTLFCNGNVIAGDQILNYFRASVCYLRNRNLINSYGHLINFSGLAVHLYYKEPDNLAFVHMFENGVFHKICSSIDLKQPVPERIVLKVLHILCTIFNKVIIPERNVEDLRKIAKTSASNIFLEPLSDNLYEVLESHNGTVFDIYQNYCTETARKLETQKCQLPISRINFPSGSLSSPALLKALSTDLQEPVVSRTPLSNLSGKGERYESFDDMVNNVREDIHLEKSTIPYFKTEEGRQSRLNSYLLDFFKHGSLIDIQRDNWIKEGYSWEMLRDFQLTLKAILVSMKQRIEARQETGLEVEIDLKVEKCFEELSEKFSENFNRYTNAK